MSDKNVLITGGSGLIGKLLTNELLKKGYGVSLLSRKAGNDPKIRTWVWDADKGMIDKDCLDGVDTIIHLAGAGIAEKRWTAERKKELIDSRTKSIRLIYHLMDETPNLVKSVISASATGYYSDRGEDMMTEDCNPADDFLGSCCVEWEKAVSEGERFGIRLLKFRTGVVLTKDGGALPQLAAPIKYYVGSPIGDGKQWIPWIHWMDVVEMYIFGLENEQLSGVYNMVAPIPVTNEQLSKAVARQLHKPFWAPNVPAFVLKMLLGEMSSVVLASTKVSADSIIENGYEFKYPGVTDALKEIYK